MNPLWRIFFGFRTTSPGPARRLGFAAAGLGLLLLACGSLGSIRASGPVHTPTAEAANGGLALTIYNQGTALVQDRRRFDLSQGLNRIPSAMWPRPSIPRAS